MKRRSSKKQRQKEGILLTFLAKKEGGRWVWTCKEFGVSSFGKDLDDTLDEVVEMTLDHVRALHEVGELDNFIARHEIKIVPLTHGIPRVSLDLPAEPIQVNRQKKVAVSRPRTFTHYYSIDRSCYA